MLEEREEDVKAIKMAISKLHTNLGHPSSHALARAIRLTGGSDLAIASALAHKCPVCDRLKSPSNPLSVPGSLEGAREFNKVLAIDLFSLGDCFAEQGTFLNCVDMASGYQIVTPVKSKHPLEIWKALMASWLSWAGPP